MHHGGCSINIARCLQKRGDRCQWKSLLFICTVCSVSWTYRGLEGESLRNEWTAHCPLESCCCCCCYVTSVVSDSVWSHRRQPTRLPHPWDSPGKNTGVGFAISFSNPWKWGVKSEVAQSCATVCDPMDCSLPGSSVHGILQARVLEWGAISSSRDIYTYICMFIYTYTNIQSCIWKINIS